MHNAQEFEENEVKRIIKEWHEKQMPHQEKKTGLCIPVINKESRKTKKNKCSR